MREVDRLIAAGILPECAVDTVLWYKQQGDDFHLEQYIRDVEARQTRRKECPL